MKIVSRGLVLSCALAFGTVTNADELPWVMEGDVTRAPAAVKEQPDCAAFEGVPCDFAFGGPIRFTTRPPTGGVIVIR